MALLLSVNFRHRAVFQGFRALSMWSLLCGTIVANPAPQAWDAPQVLKRLEKTLTLTSPFSAKIRSKMMMANRSLIDTGKIEALPPHCQKITWSGTTQSTCDDTTWVRSSNGDITRSIGSTSPGLPGMGGGAMGLIPMPVPKQAERRESFDTLGHVMVLPGSLPGALALKMGDAKSESGVMVMEIDTTAWVPIKVTHQVPGQLSMEMGFKFTAWKGKQVLAEMRMVIPNGFIVLEITEYQTAKGLRRQSFKLL